MARPKIRRRKRAATVPGIPVYKPLQRPVQLQEDLLATVVADGVHREGSEAGFGTGGGEWGFHAANAHRPKPIRHLMEYEDQARHTQLMLEVEGWIRDCADDYVQTVGVRRPRVFRASAGVSFGGHLFTLG